MSRTRNYGRSIAVQTAGPDAVETEKLEATKELASERLMQHFSEFVKSALGISLDADTFETYEKQEADRYVIGYTITGRQKRNVLSRIWRAIKA